MSKLGSKKTDEREFKGDILLLLVGTRLGFIPFELVWLLIHHSLMPCGPDAGQSHWRSRSWSKYDVLNQFEAC